MVLSREEKERLVLDLYYNKGCTYRDIAKELKMSPNQIRDIIKRHEEKNNAIADKKNRLSLSSKAYKLFSTGKTNVEVAIRLDIPQPQVTQFRLEYQKLKGLDDFESLYITTKGKVTSLWKLYQELVIKRGMSNEEVANVVDIALNRLPYMETLYEKAHGAALREQEKVDYLENRIRTLKEEKRNRMILLPSSSYYYVNEGENPAMKTYSYYSSFRQPSPLPYWTSVYPDLSKAYRDEQEKLKEKEEIRGVDEGDIAD